MLLVVIGAVADDKLSENFESGLPTSAPSNETTVT